MLRGMGWTEGRALGRKDMEVRLPVQQCLDHIDESMVGCNHPDVCLMGYRMLCRRGQDAVLA